MDSNPLPFFLFTELPPPDALWERLRKKSKGTVGEKSVKNKPSKFKRLFNFFFLLHREYSHKGIKRFIIPIIWLEAAQSTYFLCISHFWLPSCQTQIYCKTSFSAQLYPSVKESTPLTCFLNMLKTIDVIISNSKFLIAPTLLNSKCDPQSSLNAGLG